MDQQNPNSGVTSGVLETSSAPQETEVSGKEYVVQVMAEAIEKATGKKSGAKTLARTLFGVTVSSIFKAAVEDGYFRFPGGFGALKIKHLKASKRRTPSTGQIVDCPARDKIVLTAGETLKTMLKK